MSVALLGTQPPPLGGSATIAAENGVATFSALSINVVGNYVLVASSGTLTPDSTSSISVTPGAATQLAMTIQPPDTVVVGTPFTIAAQARDAFANLTPAYTDTASVVIASGPTGSLLGGSVRRSLTAGLAEFSGLSVNRSGAYQLSVGAPGLTAASTITFFAKAAAPASINKVSGDAQSGTVNTTITNPLAVEVRDANGNPVGDVSVAWTVQSGAATLTAGTVLTNSSGVSSTSVVLGTTAGSVVVRATVGTLPPAEFTVTSVAAAGVILKAITAPASGTAGTALPTFRYGVYDQYNNQVNSYSGFARVTLDRAVALQPVPVILGGDSVSVVNGVATWAALAVATAGKYRIVANFGSALGTIASDTLSVATAAPSLLVNVSGSGQSVAVTQAAPDPLRARVTDAYGNGIRNVNVIFSLVSGSSTLGTDSSASVPTDSTGHAGLTPVMGTVAGPVVIQAIAEGITQAPLQYSLTTLAGAAATFVVVSGNNQSIPAGGSSDSVRLRLNDANGNAVSGATVTWSQSTDLTFSPASGVTDANGVTATRVTSGGLLGAKSFTASSSPAGVATLSIATVPGAASALNIVSGANQSGTVLQPLASPIVLRVVDAFGNGRVGDSVVVSVTAGGGILGSGTATQTLATDSQGAVSVQWTLGSLLDTQTISASTSTLPAVTVSATALSAVANLVWTGNVSNSVAEPLNWRGGLLPTLPTDSVLIPAGRPFYPLLGANLTFSRFTLESGATLDLGNSNLIVNGRISAPVGSGMIASGGGKVIAGANVANVITGTYPRLQIEGSFLSLGVVDVVDSLLITGMGSFSMQANDSLHVGNVIVTSESGYLQQSGNSGITAGNLSLSGGTSSFGAGGRLYLIGSLSTGVNGAPTAFVADSTHTLILWPNATQTITFAFADSTPGGPCEASCLGTVTGTKTLDQGGVTFGSTAMARGGFQLDVQNLGVTGQYLVNGAPSSILFTSGGNFRRFGFTGSFTLGGLYTAGNLVAFGSGALPAGLSVPTIVEGSYSIAAQHNDDLIVRGVLDVVGSSASVTKRFFTSGSGQLRMTDATDVLTVFGEAEFSGGASVLSAGTLRLQRSLKVLSPQGFQGQPGHTTEFWGGVSQPVNFSAPGFGAQQSYFGRVLLNKTGDNPLSSTAVYVNGQLVTANTSQLWRGAGSGTPLIVRGANISALWLISQPLVIEDGGAISSLAGLRFSDFTDSLGAQLTINRSGGAVNLVSPSFQLAPSPVYLRAIDNSVNGDSLSVLVSTPTPLYHGGRIASEGEGLIDGWATAAVVTWIGGTSNWFTASNWSTGFVPTRMDSVVVGNGGNATPVLSAPTTVRALNWQTSTFQLSANLTIRGSYSDNAHLVDLLPPPTIVTCTLGGRLTFAPITTATARGVVACPVYVSRGVLNAGVAFTADSLIIQGDGEFAVQSGIATLRHHLRTVDKGTLRMGVEGQLRVQGNADFSSTPKEGALAGGLLTLYGNFAQGSSPTAFRPARAHRTAFKGSAQQIVTFAHPNYVSGSYFGTLSVEQLDSLSTAVVLQSDVLVDSVLEASSGTKRELRSDNATLLRRISSRGAFTGLLGSLSLHAVAWDILDGAAITDTIRNVAFASMPDSGTTQLRIARSGGTVYLKSFSFDQVAQNPSYLEAEGLSVDSLFVHLTLPAPSEPAGGQTKASGTARIVWPAPAPQPPIALNSFNNESWLNTRLVASRSRSQFVREQDVFTIRRPFPTEWAWTPPSG